MASRASRSADRRTRRVLRTLAAVLAVLTAVTSAQGDPAPRLSLSAPAAPGHGLPRLVERAPDGTSASGGTVLARFAIEPPAEGFAAGGPVRLEIPVSLGAGLRPPRLWWRKGGEGWTSVPSSFDWRTSTLSADLSEATGEISLESGEDVYFHALLEAGQVGQFTGAAIWSLPLAVPAGAGGLSIPLTITYNSDQINSKTGNVATDGSWLGLGFDLDVGRIVGGGTFYRLDAMGQSSQLIPSDPGQPLPPPTDCSQNGWTCTESVHRLSTEEANYWKIEVVRRNWHRQVCSCPHCVPDPAPVTGYIQDDSYFRIWDHDGTRYEFGTGSVGSNLGFEDLPWNTWATGESDWEPSSRSYRLSDVPHQGHDHERVLYAQFGLEKVVDAHGNTLEVHWLSKGAKKRQHGCDLPEYGFKESYPERIRYTTNPEAGDDHAEYEIVFESDEKDFDTLEDAGIAQTSRWLNAVKVYFHPVGMPEVLIKEYRFKPYVDETEGNKAYYLDLIEEYGKNGTLLRTIDPRWVFIPDAVKLNEGPGSEKDRWFLEGIADNGYGGSVLFTYEDFDLHRSRRQIVDTVTVDPGFGTTLTSNYDYFDPEIRDHDPGDFETLIGFERVHETAPSGIVTRTYFEDIDHNPGDWRKGKISATEVYGALGSLRRRTELSWAKQDLSNPHHRFVYQTARVNKSWSDDGVLFASKELYQYLPEDQNCHHPTQPCSATGAKQRGKRTRTFFYPDIDEPWTLLTLHRYAVNEDAGIVRRVQEQTKRNDGAQWTTLARTDHLYIDGSLNFTGVPNAKGERRASRSQVEIGQDLFAYTPRLTYDAFGNVVASREFSQHGTASAWPTGGADTTITFDVDHHLFPTRVRNALGHETETRYYFVEGVADGAGNGRPGQPKRVTDANGVHQSFTRFDNHGRLTHRWDNQPEAWNASLAQEVRTYTDRSVAGTGGSVKVSTRDDLGTGAATYLWRATFFDGAGRTVQTQREAIGAGKAMVVNARYDATGALASTTRAHKVASSGGFLAADYDDTSHPATYTEYDELRRPARTFGYDGSYVETEYDVGGHRGTREIDAERAAYRHLKLDAYGRTFEVEEGPLGGGAAVVTGYEYDDLGNLVEVEDAAGNLFSWTYDALGRILSEDDPDRGLTTFEYDASGRETRRTDALGNVVSTTYDVLGRKKQQHAGSAGAGFALADRTWTYDLGAYGLGRLSHAVSRNAQGQLEHQRSVVYDSRGRTVGVTWTTAGVSRSRSYAYDAAGRVFIETDHGEDLVTTYNNAGLPDSLTAYPPVGPPSHIDLAVAGFDAEDRMSSITYGNGVSQTFEWYGAAEAFRLEKARVTSPVPGVIPVDLTYGYDDNGRITQITEYGAPPGLCGFDVCTLVQDFDYDFLGRLTSASTLSTPGAGGVYSRAYAYDAVGNVTLVTRDGVPETYGYDPDHPHAVRWRNGADRYQYDDAGNMTVRWADNGIPYGLAWTPYGQLDLVTGLDGGVTFHWGPDGELVRKYSSWEGASTIYAGPDYELDGTVPVKYYNFAGKRIAVKRAGDLIYLAGDHLGSTSIATDHTGALVSSKRYLPFGRERYSAGTSPTDRLFTGERRHDDIGGLYHMGARFYDPEVLRWTSADTILPDAYSSQQLNRYTYALNDPLRWVDPTGHYVQAPDDGANPCISGGPSGVCTVGMSGLPLTDEEMTALLATIPPYEPPTPLEETIFGALPVIGPASDFFRIYDGLRNDDWGLVGEGAFGLFGGRLLEFGGDLVSGLGRLVAGGADDVMGAVPAGTGARFVGNSAGDLLDTASITIPEGKFGYLLSGSSKSGVFADSMGFTRETLDPALRSHLIDNFGTATRPVPMTGGGIKFSVEGPMVGPSGQKWTITTAWGVDPDGTLRLITATP